VTQLERRALKLYAPLPWAERLLIRARLSSAPLNQLSARAPAGKILDLGCGHGLLAALLALDRPDREVIGVDPDERKIKWARTGPGSLPNVAFRVGVVEDLSPEFDGFADAVAVADVLYLLPVEQWARFVRSCRRLIKPTGILLLKEAEANRSWKSLKCLLQEQLMVRVLKKTRGSGGLALKPRSFIDRLLRENGFAVREVVDLSSGYSTPHLLFTAEAR
jgi:2-polyprenyl-6-hydroxyphenyl methylase/3-demethylubiquinone-9 3-methyltransferase